jgi:hypothetical protein
MLWLALVHYLTLYSETIALCRTALPKLMFPRPFLFHIDCLSAARSVICCQLLPISNFHDVFCNFTDESRFSDLDPK